MSKGNAVCRSSGNARHQKNSKFMEQPCSNVVRSACVRTAECKSTHVKRCCTGDGNEVALLFILGTVSTSLCCLQQLSL